MKKKKILVGFFVILGVAVLFGGLYLNRYLNYQKEVNAIQNQFIDISKLEDGTYAGECNVDFISAKVSVVIKQRKIDTIELLEHKNERGKAAESIIDSMIELQNVNVDAISGATNSSKVIQQAVRNALTSAPTKDE